MNPPARNQPCPCGSGKKFKHCCVQGAKKKLSLSDQQLSVQLETGQLLSITQAMAHALQLHQAGRIHKAEAIYRQIVQKQPGHADAQHLLGLVCHQTGQHELAYAQISHAISLNARAALFHNNLGEVCRALHRLEEAQTCYAKAIALQPEMLEAIRNIGLALLEQNKLDEAVTHLQKVVARYPDYMEGYLALSAALVKQHKETEGLKICELGLGRSPHDLPLLCAKGQVLNVMGQQELAIQHYRQAINQQPNAAELYNCLYGVLKQAGDIAGALECLQNEIRLRPNYGTAQHLLNSLQNVTTDRAPASYISELFNGYADSFDQHLVNKLECRIPSMLANMLFDVLNASFSRLNILDLGCGTGLFGAEIKKIKKNLVGIDLATKMIQRARERNLYDQLIVGDLLEYMTEIKSGEFDLLAATDVFNYVGNLQSVFEQANRILPTGGWFVFSLEAAQEDVTSFVLDKTGRYRHGRTYVPRLCAEHNLMEQNFVQATLRINEDKPVLGYLYLLKKM